MSDINTVFQLVVHSLSGEGGLKFEIIFKSTSTNNNTMMGLAIEMDNEDDLDFDIIW